MAMRSSLPWKRARSSGKEWHAARIGTLVGSICCLILFGALAYFAFNSDHRKATARGVGCTAAAVFSLVGIGRALLGTVREDE